MPITLVAPEGLPKIDLYHQVAVATGTRTVYTAGQVAWGPDGSTVGEGDLAAQAEQCYRNLGTALAAVDATFADVVKLTAYVVDLSPATMGPLLEGIARATSALGITATPPLTGIGVASLAAPDLLVEVEAVAVLD